MVPTLGLGKASPAARRPCQSACPGGPSCSQQPQNTARATGFSHTRQKPRASCLAPCSQLSLPRTPLPGGRRSSAKGRPAALAGNRTRVNCLEGSYAHHYTTNAAQPGPPPDAGPGLAPAHSRRSRRRIPAPTPRQREALRRRRRHQQPTSNPFRASSTQRPGSTGPTAPGRRSRGLAAPRPFAPRRGPRTPPPSPPGGNAGHAASSSQLAKALLHRALGEATSHDDRGTREPAACRRHGALPRRAGREPRSPLRQPLWAGGPQDPAMVGQGRGGGQGGRRSAVATERPATTEGSGWRAAPVEGVGGGQAPGPKADGGDEGPLGARRQDREPPRPPKRLCCLPVGESNPGLPRDRRGYSPLY